MLATARKPAAAADLQRLREAHADKLLISELDVASPQSVERFAAEAKARLAHVDVSSVARAGEQPGRGTAWLGSAAAAAGARPAASRQLPSARHPLRDPPPRRPSPRDAAAGEQRGGD